MGEYDFSMTMEVRDYECDIQGIVNNGVYQNYLEHVRHKYLKHVGIDFAEYAKKGINLVVIRAELDYKLSLISGDTFVIGLRMVRESKARFAFFQDIFRQRDNKPVLKAKIIGTALNARGRPSIPAEMDKLLRACEIIPARSEDAPGRVRQGARVPISGSVASST